MTLTAARVSLTAFTLTVFLCFSIGFDVGASAQISTRTAFRLRSGTSLPATCTASAGDVFFLISGNIGIYACTSTDTWSATVTNITTAGITASTSQSQGQGALTTNINQVSVVANDDDTVTLPSATAGLEVLVINDGANSLQIFPASGDDLGLGVNLPVSIEASDRTTFVAYDSTNWDIETTTLVPHAEMHDIGNTDAFGVSAADNVEVYHTNGIHVGDVSGWTFDIGGGGTAFTIDAVALGPLGEISLTTASSHGLAVGAIVSHANMTDSNYEGVFVVQLVPTSTTYTVTATFGLTNTGTMNEASTLTADALAVGDYLLSWSASATTATNNDTFDFDIYINATKDDGMTSRNKFGTATDVQSVSGVGIVSVVSGTKISFGLINNDSAGDITIRNFVVTLHRL